MAAARRVLVVGGGIAGLTVAAALRRVGIEVVVAELQPAWDLLGTGISITGPTLRALRSIGLIDAAVAAGFSYSELKLLDPSGCETGTIDLPPLNGPDYPAQIATSRQALHGVVLAAAETRGAELRLGTSVTGLEQSSGEVRAVFTDGTRATFDLVVGADGLHSRVRSLVFPDALAPRFTGLAVWRYTMERFTDLTCMCVGYGAGSKPGLNPVSADEMFLFVVSKIEDGSRPPTPQLPVLLREQLTGYQGMFGRARERIVDPERCDYRPMVSLLMPQPWYCGRVILIGDAAHTTTPHLATGAGIAIEDAVVLAEELEAQSVLADALAGFMHRRFERCRLVVETALRLGEWEKDPAIPAQAHLELIRDTYAKLAAPI